MMARQAVWRARWAYVGVDWLPYQVALGLSLRLLAGPHLRLYVGPIKFYAGRREPIGEDHAVDEQEGPR